MNRQERRARVPFNRCGVERRVALVIFVSLLFVVVLVNIFVPKSKYGRRENRLLSMITRDVVVVMKVMKVMKTMKLKIRIAV